MQGRYGIGAVSVMTDHDGDIIQIVTERSERRLAEECGSLRVDMATGFGELRADMAGEFGKVRAEMASESGKLRAEIATESGKLRAEMQQGFGAIRTEMADRNSELLRWGLIF